jgi:hypothetical protein
MYIVKSLKDYADTDEKRQALEKMKELLPNETCHVAIKNRKFIQQYFAPLHDFVAYTAGLDSIHSIRAMARVG